MGPKIITFNEETKISRLHLFAKRRLHLKEKTYTLDTLVRTVLAIGGIVLFMWILHSLRAALIPFGIAFLAAYLLNPVVTLLHRKLKNRAAAVGLTLGGITLLGFGALWVITPLIYHEFHQLGIILSKLASESNTAARLQEVLPENLWQMLQEQLQRDQVIQMLKQQKYLEPLQQILQKLLPGAFNLVSGTFRFLMSLMGIILVLLYLVFMLSDYQRIRNEIRNLIPVGYLDAVLELMDEFDKAMSRYFRAQAVVAFLVGILFAIGFSIIGMPMAIITGLSIGLLNMVPYLQLAGLIPAAFLAAAGAAQNETSIGMALLACAAVFGIVQLIQDAVLVPKIMGKVTGLSPAMILLSVSIWGQLMGFLGLLAAIPFTCIFLAYYERLQARNRKLRTQKNTIKDTTT